MKEKETVEFKNENCENRLCTKNRLIIPDKNERAVTRGKINLAEPCKNHCSSHDPPISPNIILHDFDNGNAVKEKEKKEKKRERKERKQRESKDESSRVESRRVEGGFEAAVRRVRVNLDDEREGEAERERVH